MNISDLEKRLNEDIPRIYTNVLIDGNWGIGKTYFIKKYLEAKTKAYVSLFGLDSLDAFKLQILIQLDKQLGIFECIKKWLSKAELSVKQISFSMPYIEVNLKKQIEKKAKERQIYIVIDDIERKSSKIKMSEVLGVIEEFKEINNVNIIMIANESEIKDKIYYKFKEKVIQKTYKVTEFSLTAKEAILQKYVHQIEQTKENNTLIKYLEEFYTKHKLKNLRTMEKSLIFLKYILANINLSNMTEQDIKKLTTVSLAVAIEKIERLYISAEEQKDIKNTIFSEQLRSLEGCILKNYLKEMVIGNNNQTLIEIIINIYDDENVEQNFQNVSEFFESVHKFSQSNTDEPLFYKSEESLRLSIQKFYELNIKTVDDSLDIDSWFKKFAEVYIYSKKIDMEHIFNEEEIKECVEKYISNMKDVDISRSKMGVHRLIFMEERDEFLTKINGYIDSCILNKYYMQRIELLEEENNYSESSIEELLNIYRVNDVKNKEAILNMIYEKNFYIPELTSDLTERSWGFTHTIWSRMSSCRTDRDNKFEEVVKKMLEGSNSIGRHRIESLNKQYGINIDEK